LLCALRFRDCLDLFRFRGEEAHLPRPLLGVVV
jgi:hypothetical protein